MPWRGGSLLLADPRSGPGNGPDDRYRTLWEETRTKSPDEIARELPGLIDTIRSTSRKEPDTIGFRIGVSVSRNATFFDYTIDRVAGDDEGVTVEHLKGPVEEEHHYLRFVYPPDPHFTPETLRGALLTTIQRSIDGLDGPPDAPSEHRPGRLRRLLMLVLI